MYIKKYWGKIMQYGEEYWEIYALNEGIPIIMYGAECIDRCMVTRSVIAILV